MNNKKTEKLIIFDTTLRDGEQSAGASMTAKEKLEIALQLERLGVDIIEAGFPIASEGDLAAVKLVSEKIKTSKVCALARTNPKDIDKAIEAVVNAQQPRIHTFIATSPLHMEKKLGLKPDEVVKRAVESVARARDKIEDVEFSAEDAGRSEFDFLCEIFEKTIDAGATTLNIPDTVGYTLPDEFSDLVRRLITTIPKADKAIFSVHCHNDLGLAVANTLAAVNAGARQVECTLNGIGERAGNAALEEIVMAMKTRANRFPCHVDINTEEIVKTSRLVSSVSGMVVQPNKAIVGANAFAHESGIHQDGVLKARKTYEIMRAEDVGWESNIIKLGKLSGRRALSERMASLGYPLDNNQSNQIFEEFKKLADTKRHIGNDELIELAIQVGVKINAQETA